MKKEGRDLVSEAVNDATALKEAAIAAAKNELLESMAPAIKNLLEKNIKEALGERKGYSSKTDAGSGQAQADYLPGGTPGIEEAKGDSEMAKHDEAEVDEALEMEGLSGFFSEAEEPEMDEASIPTLGEGHEEEEEEEEKNEAKKKGGEEMDESIEISEAELRKVYEAALQTEVQVKKGFSEMTPNGELDDVVKDVDKGLADVKKGEHEWDKETPPAKQDFVVKEMIKKGMAENKALRENLKKAVQMIKVLGNRLHEVNLFNSKVLHVNRILNKNAGLTSEQKRVVLESIDKAKTIDEVKTVYEVVTSSFAVAGKLTESRKPLANSQRARTSGGADQKVLSESADRNVSDSYSRLAQLAGLLK